MSTEIMINRSAEKYLKPTHIASYSPRVGYARPSLLPVFAPASKRFWKGLTSRLRDLLADHLFSNIALVAVVTRALAPTRAGERVASVNLAGNLRSAFNWFFALLMLILASPLFFLLALAIKLDSTGPVFFMQERVGRNRRRHDRRTPGVTLHNCRRRSDRRQSNLHGKPFMVYKFRTMVVDAEKRCGPIWATKNDPRITKVGKFLRKTRLDELPQLINVLRGEMMIVGPRPERPFFVEKLSRQIDGYIERLTVKPGITGLAQVENGYDSSVDDVKTKVAYDLQYIKSSSVSRDLIIMLKTIGVVLGCRGV
jgi:lipopolysaccharide/colanic/teichoic acid biosynthesis glycosyltransferase